MRESGGGGLLNYRYVVMPLWASVGVSMEMLT